MVWARNINMIRLHRRSSKQQYQVWLGRICSSEFLDKQLLRHLGGRLTKRSIRRKVTYRFAPEYLIGTPAQESKEVGGGFKAAHIVQCVQSFPDFFFFFCEPELRPEGKRT